MMKPTIAGMESARGSPRSLTSIFAETQRARRDVYRPRRAFTPKYVAGRRAVRSEGGTIRRTPLTSSRCGDCLADPQADAKQPREIVEPQRVGAVGEGFLGARVD